MYGGFSSARRRQLCGHLEPEPQQSALSSPAMGITSYHRCLSAHMEAKPNGIVGLTHRMLDPCCTDEVAPKATGEDVSVSDGHTANVAARRCALLLSDSHRRWGVLTNGSSTHGTQCIIDAGQKHICPKLPFSMLQSKLFATTCEHVPAVVSCCMSEHSQMAALYSVVQRQSRATCSIHDATHC